MTTDLPFVHRAQDPSMETTARARSPRTVRRRRAQRLAVGSAAFVALAVAGVAVVVLPSDDDATDGGLEVASERGLGDREDIQPNTAWSDPVLSEDGLLLTITVGSQPPGDGSCTENYEYEVVETDRSVTVGFEKELPTSRRPAGDGIACTSQETPQRFDIELGAPLGDRQVFDGVRPEPQTVHRLAELVDVTLPDGWTAAEPLSTDGETGRWQQAFQKDGADWYFTIQQQPEADATTPEGTPTPVTVHGIEGLRYSGQMNNTMESIVWVEGGLSITVWGEWQGPPSSTDSDELLQIAVGVQLPTANG